MKNKRQGFTLIELLVVVAIIGLLVSILLPSLRQARRQAKQVMCGSQLRAQGQAAKIYSGEMRDFIPCGILSNDGPAPGDAPPGAYSEYGLTHQVLLPYLGYTPEGDGLFAENRKWQNLFGEAPGVAPNEDVRMQRLSEAYATMDVYQCPDFQVSSSADGTITAATSFMDYAVNAMPIPFTRENAQRSQSLEPDSDPIGIPVDSVWYIGERKEATVTRQADFIYMVDVSESIFKAENLTNEEGQNFRFSHFFMTSHLPFAGQPRIAGSNRHSGGVNALFFDGHAETLSPNGIDPGWPNSQSLRLRYFSDTSQLPRRFQ